jgi:RecB family exonuclease
VPPEAASDSFVLVPSRAAAEQLRRTLEDELTIVGQALTLPRMAPRADWYSTLAARLAPVPRTLSAVEREVLLAASAREVEVEGLAPPFRLRPGLVAEMLALYDHLHRLGRSVADFERLFLDELEPSVGTDRGAERLFEQTSFLSAAFAEYETRVAASAALDEAALRRRLLTETAARPVNRLIVSVGDRLSDPHGLWPADFDLVARLHGLAAIDIVNTEAALASGLLERLHAMLPGLEQVRAGMPAAGPVLEVPGAGGTGLAATTFISRDREEELASAARRVKVESLANGGTRLNRVALVVARPLPYLYLAREVFGNAGIPFEALDTLPLAAEPYAAAVDLVLDCAIAGFSRRSLVALLASPHFGFPDAAGAPTATAAPPASLPARASVAALDEALAEARYRGSLEELEAIHREWSAAGPPARREEHRRLTALPALKAALQAAAFLAPLTAERDIVVQIETLLGFLRGFELAPGPRDPDNERRLRVSAAVRDALMALAIAHRRHDPHARADAADLSAAVHRWLEGRTFAARSGKPGVQIVDAAAARYGIFDEVQLVGLIDGEWPEPPRRTIFYPASLMALLEPAPPRSGRPIAEREAMAGARAAFHDLLRLAHRRVRVSTFLLEDDAIVEPSILLDEIPRANLRMEAAAEPINARVSLQEAMTLDPPAPAALPPGAAAWAQVRLEPRDTPGRFRGASGPWVFPRVSVSRLERYLDCPFRFFASEVLGLEEEPDDEDTRTPLERGRFLHELFEAFFAEWQRRGHVRISPDTLPAARAVFEEVCEKALATLPAVEAALERTRLLGSAVSPGIAHRVLSLEAEQAVEVTGRLLEFPLEGEFTFRARDGRRRAISLSAKADRIDLLSNGAVRVIDYKSRQTPDLKQALQLPIYSFCARQRLAGYEGREWTLAEAAYLSFEGDRAVIPLRARGSTLDDLIDEAQDRMLTALDDIAEGSFPPRPARKSLCSNCPYATVCRREWVEADASRGDEND